MPNTSKQGFPYPASSAAPNVPADIQSLAQSVENRVVQIYASSADRSTKQTAPVEGMMSWLQDVNAYYYYNGSAWVKLVEFIGDAAFDNAVGTTASTSFTNLTSVAAGPAVSLNLTKAGVVAVHCTTLVNTSSGTNYCLMGVGLTGATVFGTLQVCGMQVGVNPDIASGVRLYTVNAGTTIFTATYRVGAGTGSFGDRVLWAVPVG